MAAARLAAAWATREGGELLIRSARPNDWLAAVEELANLHRAGESLYEGLAVPTFDLQGSFERLSSLLEDRGVLEDWGLSPELLPEFSSLLPRLEAVWSKVAGQRLETAPLHGDSHPMNALFRGDSVGWFDWAEALLGPPLLDIGWFLAWLSHPARSSLPVRRQEPNITALLWGHYLDASGLPASLVSAEDAVLFALSARAALFDERYREWAGTVPGWRPQVTPYLLKWLARHPGAESGRTDGVQLPPEPRT